VLAGAEELHERAGPERLRADVEVPREWIGEIEQDEEQERRSSSSILGKSRKTSVAPRRMATIPEV
jgi:hypothetical protein